MTAYRVLSRAYTAHDGSTGKRSDEGHKVVVAHAKHLCISLADARLVTKGHLQPTCC